MNESEASVSKVDVVLMGYTVTRVIVQKGLLEEVAIRVSNGFSCRIKKRREN